MTVADGGAARGAYGLRLPPFAAAGSLCEAPDHWAPWSFSWADAAPAVRLMWSDTAAHFPLRPAGVALIDAVRQHTTLCATGSTGPSEAFLHPQLGTTALAAAAWRHDLTLHGGVVVVHGRAWGIVGEKGAGKSSALAWSAAAGRPVAADDLVITDGRVVRSGPRFLDLRASAAAHLGIGVDVGVLGSRRRWRVPLPEVPAELPFGGLVELGWAPPGTPPTVTAVPMADRLDLLRRHRGLHLDVDLGRSALLVLARPVVRFERPKVFEQLDEAMTLLVDSLAALG